MPKPCDPMAKNITELAMVIGAEDNVKSLDDIVAEMGKLLPDANITRESLVASINEATSGYAKALTETQKKLNTIRRMARSQVGLRKKIDALQKHISDGTLPEKRVRVDQSDDTVRQLREIRSDLQKELGKSEPAVRQRLEKQIEDLEDRLENGVRVPTPEKVDELRSKEIERLAFERDKLRARINSEIRNLKPRSVFGRVVDVINLARSVMTSMDLSAVLRQGGMVTLGHPVMAARAFVPMFRALASEQGAAKIRKSIDARENAPYYHRSGLYLSPPDGATLSAQEEAFMSRILENAKNSKIGKAVLAPVHGSQRAYTTFLDTIRADMFDAMSASLARNGEPTLDEMKAIANYINVATGRGGLGKLESSATNLNTIFFAPRYLASRFQLLAGQPFYGGTNQTRMMIAKEYARALIGVGAVYALGAMAGGELEEDPRSADFGKMRFGNTRLDPLAGLAQVTTFTSRMVTGETKDSYGEVKDLRGPNQKFGKTDALDVLVRFGRSKLAPFPGAIVNIATGENFAGEPTGVLKEAQGLVTPIGMGEIYEVMKENGVEKGTALSILGLFGMGLQHYERQKPKKDHSKLKPLYSGTADKK